jgi:hypothetical protein
MCKVILGPAAFSRPDMFPPAPADIDLHGADWKLLKIV